LDRGCCTPDGPLDGPNTKLIPLAWLVAAANLLQLVYYAYTIQRGARCVYAASPLQAQDPVIIPRLYGRQHLNDVASLYRLTRLQSFILVIRTTFTLATPAK
jgi:hypothetical protein